MRIFSEKYRIIAGISLVLYTGFAATGIAAFFLARGAEQQSIVEQTLPLISDAVHADIRAEVMRPVLAASMMSDDRRVRDWLLDGESDSGAMLGYLEEIRKMHDVQGAFLASERTRNYYGADGIVSSLQQNSTQDAWFFRAREATTPFSMISGSSASRNAATLLVTQRMFDQNGNFVAVTGVAVRAERLMRVINNYQQRHGSRIQLIDAQRRIAPLEASTARGGDAIEVLPGLRDIARALLHGGNAPVQLSYQRDGGTVYVSSRFMPEFGWHLLVERDDDAGGNIARQVLMSSLLIGAGMTVLMVVLMLLTVNRYYQQLEQMAGSDPLTGLLNRQAFDIVFRQAMLEADRNGRPLSGILFDVDFIRQVNEMHGYAAGDEVLRTIARIARALLRESDVFTRWNGEEFFILLKECRVEQAVAVAEKIRQEVDRHDFSAVVADGHITISLGVVQHDVGETASLFFARADEALLKAKMNGRNRLQVALGNSAVGPEETAAT